MLFYFILGLLIGSVVLIPMLRLLREYDNQIFELELSLQRTKHTLPVLKTCGSCGWCKRTEESQNRGLYAVCHHPKMKDRHIIDDSQEPPMWCPLKE